MIRSHLRARIGVVDKSVMDGERMIDWRRAMG